MTATEANKITNTILDASFEEEMYSIKLRIKKAAEEGNYSVIIKKPKAFKLVKEELLSLGYKLQYNNCNVGNEHLVIVWYKGEND